MSESEVVGEAKLVFSSLDSAMKGNWAGTGNGDPNPDYLREDVLSETLKGEPDSGTLEFLERLKRSKSGFKFCGSSSVALIFSTRDLVY